MVEKLSPAAFALLKVLSVLDPDQIPEEILTKGSKDVELDQYPKKRVAYFDARAELMKSSLVTRDYRRAELRTRRLVQDVVRQKLTDDELLHTLNSAAVLVSAVWPFLKFQSRNLTSRRKVCEKYFAHRLRVGKPFLVRGSDPAILVLILDALRSLMKLHGLWWKEETGLVA
jgi:hypothetical protein